jgi:nucleotide-binding universal stress UspA family protein
MLPEFSLISQVPDVGRVVVGASGSPGSLCALRWALSLARANAAPLSAVIAWVPPGGDLAERRYPNPALRRLWIDAARQRLVRGLEEACGSATPEVELTLVTVRGEPGPSLVDVADRSDDLLVIGAGRRGRLSRMWHGRVSRYCLAHARCPVLAIPAPASPRELGLNRVSWMVHHRDLTLDEVLRAGRKAA